MAWGSESRAEGMWWSRAFVNYVHLPMTAWHLFSYEGLHPRTGTFNPHHPPTYMLLVGIEGCGYQSGHISVDYVGGYRSDPFLHSLLATGKLSPNRKPPGPAAAPRCRNEGLLSAFDFRVTQTPDY